MWKSRDRKVLAASAVMAVALVAVAGLEPVRATAQDGAAAPPAPRRPLPPGVVARIDGQDVSVEEYKDFLYRKTHLSRIMECVDEVLIRKKAESLGVILDEDELIARVDRQIDDTIERLHGGDRAQFDRTLRRRFHSIDSYRRWQADLLSLRVLEEGCIRNQRNISDAEVRQKFEELYGPDGVHLQVRHIQFNLPKPEDIPAPNPEARAAEVLAELQHDPDLFEEMVKKHCQNAFTRRRGGLIVNYRKEFFGDRFHAAVTGLKPGQITGPVETSFGFHIVMLVRRTVTSFDEVKDEIRLDLTQQAPTTAEKAQFRKDLRQAAQIDVGS